MVSKVVEEWVNQACYDFETAKAMQEAQRHLYVLFCCQQAVEKMLKALIAKRINESPPRTHNLIQLSKKACLDLTESQEGLLRDLAGFYIATRYPEEIEKLVRKTEAVDTATILAAAEDVLKWLKSML